MRGINFNRVGLSCSLQKIEHPWPTGTKCQYHIPSPWNDQQLTPQFPNALEERNAGRKVLYPVEKHCLYELRYKKCVRDIFPQLQFNFLKQWSATRDKWPVKVITHVLVIQASIKYYQQTSCVPKNPSSTITMVEFF